MRDLDDAELGSLIKVMLRVEADLAGVGAHVKPADLVAGQAQRRADRLRTRPLRLLALAAALLLPVGLLAAATWLIPRDTVTGTVALFGRMVSERPADGVRVVAVAADGRERELATFTITDAGSAAEHWPGVADPSGRVALIDWADGGAGFALVDLGDPGRAPTLVHLPEPGIGAHNYAWGPGGRFATTVNGGTLLVVDPDTGTTRTYRPVNDTTLDGLRWAADGSGVITQAPDLGPLGVERFTGDSGALTPDPVAGVPALHPDPWRRALGQGGRRIAACTGAGEIGCVGTDPQGSIQIQAEDGRHWSAFRSDRPDERVRDASFAADGRGFWVLADRVDGTRSHVLLRVDPGGADGALITQGEAIARIVALPDVRQVRIDGIASDDSLLVLGLALEDAASSIVVPTDGTPATYHEGAFMGFADAQTAASWDGGEWQVVASAVAPREGEPIVVPALEDLVVALDGPVNLEMSGDASTGSTGVPVSTSDVVTLSGASLWTAACLGPSPITIELSVPIADQPALLVDCLMADRWTWQPPNDMQGPIQVTVTADAGTTWRLAVQAPPSSPRRP